MQRGALVIAAGVPLLVCLLVGALWARSEWYSDRIGQDRRLSAASQGERWYWNVTSDRGRITAAYGKSKWFGCPSRSKPQFWNVATATSDPRPSLAEATTFERTPHNTNVVLALPHGAIVATGGAWLMVLCPIMVYFSQRKSTEEET